MTSSTDARKREQDARKREQDEMVKTAASLTASVEKMDPMPRALATADSSGFVDMSAFSASDPNWVENALASARGEEAVSDRPKPTPTVRGILLAPQTIRPVALSSLVEPPPSARRRVGAFAAGAIGACLAVVIVMLGVSAIARAPDALANGAMSDAVRDAALASFMVPTAAPESSATPPASPLASSSVAAPTPSASIAPIATTPKPRAKPSQIGATTPSRANPAQPPKPRAASGGSPSLEEMMRRAAQPPAKPKK